MRGSSESPVADNQGAAAQRATKLVRRDGQQIDAEEPEIDRDLAESLNRIAVNERCRGAAASATTSRTGWMMPVSLLASMTLTSAGGPGRCRLKSGQIDHSSRA